MAAQSQTPEGVASIPDKLYFKIGEVAEIVGVKPYVLRYWETEFPEIAPGKTKTKQRLYKRKGVELILQVRDLLYKEKFTIEGARRWLKERSSREEVKLESSPTAELAMPTAQDLQGKKEILLKVREELEELGKLFE